MHRRQVIKGLAALGGTLGAGRLLARDTAPSATGAGSCRLISQDVTGPFHTDHYVEQSNLMEGQSGVPLTLNFQVKDVLTCKPLAGAKVLIWHANNEGHYSGVRNVVLNADGTAQKGVIDFTEETFCRGMQTTDGDGRAQFVTTFPGWYFPRATHIHLKIYPPGLGEEATTQLYLRNENCDEVYATEHYRHRGPNPTRRNPGEASKLFSYDEGDLWMNISKVRGGYATTHELGVISYGGMFGELPDYYRPGS
jgi:protocatechuate 3,4-dioxygenase beta subunit